MINKLKEPHSMEAVKFLRQYLLDAIEFTEVPDQHNHLIEFLAAEGVLTPADSSLNMVRLSSPLVGTYIKMDVLPELFPHAPQSEIPLDRYQKLDILKMLQVVVTFFDMDLICLAPLCCFKKATVPVNDKSGRKIPRESTYDQELIRILRNWLVSYTVTGQWHLTEVSQDGDYVHCYIDIVINGNEENIVLELVATANQSNLEEHFNHALSYENSRTQC
ncbi:2464_t:CDS:2 [Entrophospora sp. SA101]|nr:2464_t:CDS:2 [Entrophospora sp. SA101]CAJ0824486.1 14312_t:CDS:2 [Entrophospora sp. SA101]